MSEIKDINKLVIKNSATIELERRKGFVNILLQGNPNLYRAWVERNNKIVIDISGESTEYNLDTNTPDYIEILKNQEDNKYYINFIGSITGETNLVSDDMTFEQVGDNTKITIKKTKFLSTDNILSGSPDYVFVSVDEAGRVRIGLNQDIINALNKTYVYLNLSINTGDFLGTTIISDYNSYGFKSGSYDGSDITVEEAVNLFKSGALLKLKLDDAGIEREYITIVYVDHFTSQNSFRMQFVIPVDYGYSLVNNSMVIYGTSHERNTELKVCIYSETNKKGISWCLSSNSDLMFETEYEDSVYKLKFDDLFYGEVEFKDIYHLFNIVSLMGNLYYYSGLNVYYPCFLYVGDNDKLYLNCMVGSTVVNKEILFNTSGKYYYMSSDIS